MLTAERRLEGGPLDGHVKTWLAGMKLEVAVECPADPDGQRDSALYDPDGRYLYSWHPTVPPTRYQHGDTT